MPLVGHFTSAFKECTLVHHQVFTSPVHSTSVHLISALNRACYQCIPRVYPQVHSGAPHLCTRRVPSVGHFTSAFKECTLVLHQVFTSPMHSTSVHLASAFHKCTLVHFTNALQECPQQCTLIHQDVS
ncbi:hypothetical protein FNV43_RR02238 [Rhamnella rubrinervis]|uniref:Uncharacterized protein n=1 Tax=Rhamnella rubrinervis TaxID=2594499 RepID=A0A8K0MTX8_9ROSA|nr:hypothetical protein FNV43_RR02238 [Rhamnella rubrinervis]